MTEIESLNRMQWEKADLGNCKSCKKTLKTPIYQYYHNQLTGENYKSGPITSIDEYGRYRLLATCRQRADASIERAPFGALKEETFCIECYEDRGTKLGAIQLHLVTDSVNAELDRSVAQL